MGGQKASEIAYAFTASHSLPTSDQSGIGSRYSIDMAVSCGYEGHHFNGSEASWYVEGGRDYLTVMMM